MQAQEDKPHIDPGVLLRLQVLAITASPSTSQVGSTVSAQFAVRQLQAKPTGESNSVLIERITKLAGTANGAAETRLLQAVIHCSELQKTCDDLRLRYLTQVRQWRETRLELFEETVTDCVEDLIRNDTEAVMSLSDADLRGVHVMLAGQYKRIAAEFIANFGNSVGTTADSFDVDTVIAQVVSECEPLRSVENMVQLLATRTRGVMTYRTRDVLDGLAHEMGSLRPAAEALIDLAHAMDALHSAERDEKVAFAEARAIFASERWDRAAGRDA